MKKTKYLALLAVGLPVTVVLFQNCSSGFEAKKSLTQEAAQGAVAVYQNPMVTIDGGTSVWSNARNKSLSFTVNVDPRLKVKDITCSLDDAPAVACTNPYMMTNLADGPHTVVIQVQDTLGQRADEARVVFQIDATKPTISFSQQPAMVSGISSVFDYVSADNLSGIAKVSCTLDGAAYDPCTRPVTLSNLADGAHTFTARAEDNAGNVSDPAQYTWMVNKNGVSLKFASTPAATTNSKTAAFTFSGTIGAAAVTYYECSVDNGGFAACTSPRQLSALADGNHTFAIKGRDASGAMSQALTYSWKVDSIAPTTPVITPSFSGAATKLSTANMAFSSTDAASGVASYHCSVDSAAFAACTSPRALTGVSEGDHTFRVKAIDMAGNESAVANFAWKVDTIVPKVELTAKPPATGGSSDATFAFTATDSGSGIGTVECQLDTAAYAACTSPKNLSGLAVGSHTFRIRATDKVGNKTDLDYTWAVQNMPTLDGKTLYVQNCQACHGTLENTILRDKTAPEISLAIATVPQMSGFASKTPAEIEAIATYLGTPQLCAPGPRPWASARLNSSQVYFTLLDTLGVKIDRALLPLDGTRSSFQNNLGLMLDSGVLELYIEFTQKEMSKLLPAFKSRYVSTCSASNPTCLKTGFSNFAKAMFHGTLTTNKADLIYSVYTKSTAAGATYDQALEDVVTATISSAEFLFPFESGRSATQKPTGLEVAHRLALLIWLSIPDATSLAKATDGSLLTEAGIKTEVDRMLKDAKGERFRKNFMGGWTGLRSFLGSEPASGSMAQNYQTETLMFFDDLIRTGAVPTAMATADYTYVNSALATQYGLSGTFGSTFAKTSLGNSMRMGLLSQGSFLTNIASPTFSTVYKRGNHVLNYLMCNPTPPPPPDVMPVEGNIDTAGLSDSEIALVHRSKSTTCYACHARMDPLGLSLSVFDQFGKIKANHEPVKPEVATMPDGTVLGDPKLLAAYLARGNRMQSCFVTGLTSYVYSGYEMANVKCAKETYSQKVNAGPDSINNWLLTLITESVLNPK